MARTAKRKRRMENRELAPVIAKVYYAAIYARLSVEKNNKEEISVETQIEIGKSFVKNHPEIRIYDIYTDIGKTGTTFERPEFERMMQDIRDRKVNCVIVKDLSRFGRNHIETANFMQKIFPFMGVRFIAVTDRVDTLQPADANQMLSVDLKNIVNELYAKDISAKIAVVKHQKMERGEYVGSVAPYGYTAEYVDGKRILIPEPGAAAVVRKIFELYVAGETIVAIRRWLYEHKIHRPMDYRKYKEIYSEEGQKLSQWQSDTVRVILSNLAYVGHLMQMSQGEQVMVEHAHEAIIKAEVFHVAAERLRENREMQKRHPLKEETLEDIFRGKLFCGNCGHGMARMNDVNRSPNGERHAFVYYLCQNNKRIDDKMCKTERITFFTLRKIILKVLELEFTVSSVQAKKMINYNNECTETKKRILEMQEFVLQKQIAAYWQRASDLYLDYRNGKINQDSYLFKKEKLENQKKEDEIELQTLKEERKRIDQETAKNNKFIRAVVKCNDATDLTADIIESLIMRINVFPEKRIEIIWNFNSEFFGRRGGAESGI